MKALLYKDFMVLRRGFWSFLLMIAIFCLLPNDAIFNMSVFFIVYAALLPVTLLSYDERSQWDKLAGMLPYTPRTIVLSKYVMGWCITLCAGVLYLAGQNLLSQTSLREIWETLLTSWAVTLLLQAVLYPMTFRFGAEKGRLTLIVVYAIVAGLLAAGAVTLGSWMPGTFHILPSLAFLAAGAVCIASTPVAERCYRLRDR